MLILLYFIGTTVVLILIKQKKKPNKLQDVDNNAYVLGHSSSLQSEPSNYCSMPIFSKFDLLVHANENEQFAETEVYPIDT